MEKLTRPSRTPATNTGFASGGVTCKLGALYFYLSSVLVDSFVLRNPPERQAPKSYGEFLGDNAYPKLPTNFFDNINK